MNQPAPFAFGFLGKWLTSTHEHEVFICDGAQEHTVHVVALDAPVVAVRNTAREVLALDARGTLSAIDPSTGRRTWQSYVGANPVSLAATDGGRWVAVVADGVRWGDGPRAMAELPIAGARFACFDAQGERFAVVAEDETFRVVEPDGTAGTIQALGAAPTGLAHSRLGWWLVSTAQGVVRIPTDGAPPQLYLRWSGKDSPTNVVCSEDGRLCAFSAGQRAVALFGVDLAEVIARGVEAADGIAKPDLLGHPGFSHLDSKFWKLLERDPTKARADFIRKHMNEL